MDLLFVLELTNPLQNLILVFVHLKNSLALELLHADCLDVGSDQPSRKQVFVDQRTMLSNIDDSKNVIVCIIGIFLSGQEDRIEGIQHLDGCMDVVQLIDDPIVITIEEGNIREGLLFDFVVA